MITWMVFMRGATLNRLFHISLLTTLRFSNNIRYVKIYRYTDTDRYIQIYKQTIGQEFWSTDDINTIQANRNCNIPPTAMGAKEIWALPWIALMVFQLCWNTHWSNIFSFEIVAMGTKFAFSICTMQCKVIHCASAIFLIDKFQHSYCPQHYLHKIQAK